MLKIVASLDEINCNANSEIGEMVEAFMGFIIGQFNFDDINRKDIEFDLDNNEISILIPVI